MPTYKLYSYDVWGNEEDGFEVNDIYPTGMEIELEDEEDNDEEMLRALIEVDFLKYTCRSGDIIFENDDEECITFSDAETYQPIGELRKEY